MHPPAHSASGVQGADVVVDVNSDCLMVVGGRPHLPQSTVGAAVERSVVTRVAAGRGTS